MLCLVGNMDWLDEKKEMTVNRQGGRVGLAADLAEIFDSKFVSKERFLLSHSSPRVSICGVARSLVVRNI